jgi:hypothetical protein
MATKKINNKIEKRFIIISCIIFIAFLITYFFFQTKDNFLDINCYLSIGVWGWLIYDYKILQNDKMYYSSIGLGLAIFFYGLFLSKNFDENISMIQSVISMPIFLLIIQRPLRFLFIKIMKREPKVEKPAPSFADFLYIFILWMTTLIILAMYFE